MSFSVVAFKFIFVKFFKHEGCDNYGRYVSNLETLKFESL